MTDASLPSVLDVRGMPPESADLGAAVEHLRGDGIVAYPTETVYGFGGRCTPEAVTALARLKGRDPDKPFLALVAELAWIDDLAWSAEARELAGIFWPGSVTLVLADPRAIFPPGVRSEAGAVAVRMSPDPWVARLLEAVGEPITSSSANLPGNKPARSGEHVVEVVRRMGAEASVVVVHAGTLAASAPSTIIDCTGDEPRVLREGSVPVSRLRCALPDIHEPNLS